MKAQMKFQKIMCLMMLICGALSAVYSFIFCSGALATIGQTLERKDGIPKPQASLPQAMLYLDVQPFNNTLLILSIVMIVAAAMLYFTACNSRRNYYISNYVATGVVCALYIAVSIYIMAMTGSILTRLNGEILSQPEVIKELVNLVTVNDTYTYSVSTASLILGFVIYPLIIIVSCLTLVNLLWKRKLMAGEKQLLSSQQVSTEASDEE